METQEEHFKWEEKNGTEHTPFSKETGDVSGRTKFGECILLPCDMSASLIRYSAHIALEVPLTLDYPVTSAGDGRGKWGWSDGPDLDKNLATGK